MSQVQDGLQIVDSAPAGDGEILVARLCSAESVDRLAFQTARRRHIEMLCASIVVMIAAAVLQAPDGHRVSLPGLSGLPFPEICFSKAWFGISCPGCGLTRSFISMMHGRWSEAFAYHRVGPFFFVIVVLQIPYRIIGLRYRLAYPLGHWVARGTVLALVFALLGNWLIGFFL